MKKIMILMVGIYFLFFIFVCKAVADGASGIPFGWVGLYNVHDERELNLNFATVKKISLFNTIHADVIKDFYDFNSSAAEQQENYPQLQKLIKYSIDCDEWTYSLLSYKLIDFENKQYESAKYPDYNGKEITEYSVEYSDKYNTDYSGNLNKMYFARKIFTSNVTIQAGSDEEKIAKAVCTPRFKIKKSPLKDFQCYNGFISHSIEPIGNKVSWCGNDTPENLKQQAEDYAKHQ